MWAGRGKEFPDVSLPLVRTTSYDEANPGRVGSCTSTTSISISSGLHKHSPCPRGNGHRAACQVRSSVIVPALPSSRFTRASRLRIGPLFRFGFKSLETSPEVFVDFRPHRHVHDLQIDLG